MESTVIPPTPQLDGLPVEILTQIFKHLPQHPRALAQLCRVCQTFRFVATELLYHDITISVVLESALDPLLMSCLLYEENVGVQYIRNITVRGNYKPDLKSFNERFDAARNSPCKSDECSPAVINATLMLVTLLAKIPRGRLESFVWDVNAFFSWKLTDKLQTLHPNLKTLKLRDGDDGPWDRLWLEEMEFSNIHSLTWDNVVTHEVIAALGNLISSNWRTLTSLNVSLRSFSELTDDYWGHVDGIGEDADDDSDGNFLPSQLFKHFLQENPVTKSPTPVLKKDPERRLKLQQLSFQKCPMNNGADSFLRAAIDLSSLQKLSLRRCPMTREFLESWVASGDGIQLKTLELLLEVGSEGVMPFLTAFKGLQNLYLLFEELDNMTRMGEIFDSIYHHEDTLRRLVIDVKRRGKTVGIPIPHIMGIKQRLKIWELGIAFKPEEGVRSELSRRRHQYIPPWADDDDFDFQMGDTGIDFLCNSCNNVINIAETITTIHIRNLRRPPYKVFDDPCINTKEFFRSKTFRHRKADAESIIKPGVSGGRNGGSLEAIIIGPVDETKPFENLGAATEFSCFLVDYVDTRVATNLPVLNPVSIGDLMYFEVPCEVVNVRW